MGTVMVNGKRFDGNNVTIRDGKVVIDGKAQNGELQGNVEVEVAESVEGRATCVASVTGVEAQANVATGASMSGEQAGLSIRSESSVTAGGRAGGAIRAVAFASADNGLMGGAKGRSGEAGVPKQTTNAGISAIRSAPRVYAAN